MPPHPRLSAAQYIARFKPQEPHVDGDQEISDAESKVGDTPMEDSVMVVGMVMMKVVPIMMVEDVSGMKLILIIEEMLQAIGPVILLKSPKGLENLERVTKASKETVYGVEKGCPTYWAVLRFVLELLILKAKYG
jgi:hypothetical protein